MNSGGFIGNAYDILNILTMDINDNDDDQLYFTKIFNKTPRVEIHREAERRYKPI